MLRNATLFVLVKRLSRKINKFLLRWYVKINYIILAFKQHEMKWIGFAKEGMKYESHIFKSLPKKKKKEVLPSTRFKGADDIQRHTRL